MDNEVRRPWKKITLLCLTTVWVPMSIGPLFVIVTGDAQWPLTVACVFFAAAILTAIRVYLDLRFWERAQKPRNLAVSGGAVLNETLTYIQGRYAEAEKAE